MLSWFGTFKHPTFFCIFVLNIVDRENSLKYLYNWPYSSYKAMPVSCFSFHSVENICSHNLTWISTSGTFVYLASSNVICGIMCNSDNHSSKIKPFRAVLLNLFDTKATVQDNIWADMYLWDFYCDDNKKQNSKIWCQWNVV